MGKVLFYLFYLYCVEGTCRILSVMAVESRMAVAGG